MPFEEQQHQEDEICNSTRFIQLILCIGCTCTSLYNYEHDSIINIAIFTSLVVISASFFLITLIDVVSSCILEITIPKKLWTMYAFFGFVLFFTTPTVFLLLKKWQNSNESKCFTTSMLVVFYLASSSFLWDGCFIIFFNSRKSVRKRKRIGPDLETADNDSISNRRFKPTGAEGDGNEIEFHLRKDNYNHMKPKFGQQSKNRKDANKIALPVSYGGTFHMSKDAVPLPSPVLRTDIARASSETSLWSHHEVLYHDKEAF